MLERVIKTGTNEGDLVLDMFMGSGTTQSVAAKLNRRFIGADVNLGAVQTTTKRLIGILEATPELGSPQKSGFDVYNVNNYDVFRNPAEAKALLADALEIQKIETSSIYDGEKDGRMVKIMPVNRYRDQGGPVRADRRFSTTKPLTAARTPIRTSRLRKFCSSAWAMNLI